MRLFIFIFIVLIGCAPTNTELARWEAHAANVTITRDTWGIPHIQGKTDADAVFGMLYTQCEDDFNRVEMNYINAMGRLAEYEGESAIYEDLRMKMFVDTNEIKKLYTESPDWLKKLMNAFADGINYYLHTHPEVTPKVITKFQPWMALTFSEGSIGTDIERQSVSRVKAFYSGQVDEKMAALEKWNDQFAEPAGSNGISIHPKLTTNGNALFLINPHTSFFFRSELQITSEEGLNAYGAVTWGQFFIYQGFNAKTGWMHTSTYSDAIDHYAVAVRKKEDGYYYQHGDTEKKVLEKRITVPYKTADGMKSKIFTTYETHHGPVLGKESDGNWRAVALMRRWVDAYRQSYLRMKTTGWDSFYEMMSIRTNSSNNTVYADADGNIGYFHGNYLPKRDDSVVWSGLVDGNDPKTDYMGLHEMSELMILKNPETGWLQNCNSTPFTAAGKSSPKRADYPKYLAPDRENYRGIHAVEVLEGKKDWTLQKLMDAAYDSRMPFFDDFIPKLSQAYRNVRLRDGDVSQALKMMQKWDKRWGKESVETTIGHWWGIAMMRAAFRQDDRNGMNVYEYMKTRMPSSLVRQTFAEALDTLNAHFGTWKTPFGEVNRLQRINGDIVQPFDDSKPSLPVKFASGRWGSLAAFGARTYPGTKKIYGYRGNSFVAVVEFGDRITAKAIVNGGQVSDPSSKHFHDQAEIYADGKFRDVWFYPEDIEKNMEERYQPGKRGMK